MKKLLFLKLLALVACLSSALSASSQIYVDGIYYYPVDGSFNTQKVMVTNQYGMMDPTLFGVGSSYTGAVTIPSTVVIGDITCTVTQIAPYAFVNCTGLTSVTIPSTVTYIGDYAFANNMTSSPNFNTISIPNSVTTISDKAFSSCALRTVTIGFGIKSIGADAFRYCSNLTTVNVYALIPPSVNFYSFGAENESLDPDQITFHFPARSVIRYKSADYGIWYMIGKIINMSTGHYDFVYNGMYYAIIGPYAVELSRQYESLGYASPYNNSSYTIPVTVTPPSSSWITGTWNVTRIGNYAFETRTNLQSIIFPTNSKVTEIGYNAFRGCTSLATLDLSNATNLTTIESYACYGANVSTVYLSSAVTEIGDYAFYDSGVSKLYTRNSTPPTIKSNTFSTRYSYCYVYVNFPRDIPTYQAAPYWSNFTRYFAVQKYDFRDNGIYYNITGTNTVEVTNKWGGNAALNFDSDYSYSGNVTIPNTVTYYGKTYNVTAIGEYAFFEARNVNLNSSGEAPSLRAQGDLKSVTIGNNVTTIKDNAFWACTGLTNVTLGTGVTSIGYGVFSGCSALTSITSRRTTPPTVQSNTFDQSHYSTATVYVPSIAAVNNYKAANYWRNFYLILPYDGTELDYALNVDGGNIHFTTDASNYCWYATGDGTRIYARSGMIIENYVTSSLYANVSLTKESTLTFDYLPKIVVGGYLDICSFYIDDELQYTTTATYGDWMAYTVDIPAGNHTLKWRFMKSSVSPDDYYIPTMNYFAVDNVAITEKPSQIGDVNGDGQVTITDLTELIDNLLNGIEVPTEEADANGDGQVNIADVTALIDMLLGS